MLERLIHPKYKEDQVFEPNYMSLLFFPSNFIVVQVQFSAFSPHPSLIPSPPHLHSVSTPCIIVYVSFITVPTNLSPFSPEIPSTPPSGYCWPFLNFSVFGYILLACF